MSETTGAFLVRARAVADSGDRTHAVQLCREFLVQNPDAPDVARLAVEVLIGMGEGPQAVDLCQDLGIALPDAIWPWGQACEPLAIALADQPELCLLAKDMVANPGSDQWVALQNVRKLLAAATWWPQLVKQLHVMIERTMRIKDQVALHDELIDTLANKLSDPLAARDARETGDQWRDVNTMIQGYWSALEVNSAEPAAWDQTEAFFRLNELWGDLAKLLEASLEGATDEERITLWTEIVDLQEKLPSPEWDIIDAKLAGEDRPNGPDAFRKLRQRIKDRQDAIAKAKIDAKKQEQGTFSMPIWLVAGLAITIGIVIATVIVLKLAL